MLASCSDGGAVADTTHDTFAVASAAASLADGQRFSVRRSWDTGSRSESVSPTAPPDIISDEEIASKKGSGDAEAVAVALGVADVLADCDCVSDGDPVGVGLAACV